MVDLGEEHTAGLAGHAQSGGLQQAKRLDILVKLLASQPQADVGEGQIAGILQRLKVVSAPWPECRQQCRGVLPRSTNISEPPQ